MTITLLNCFRNHGIMESCNGGITDWVNHIIIIIIRFLINMQGQGQHPHQSAPFQIAGLLDAWQISHQISSLDYKLFFAHNTLLANLVVDKLMVRFSKKLSWHFIQIVSLGYNLYEMSKPIFWEKWEKYFKMSSAEIFTKALKPGYKNQTMLKYFNP